jgi:hypothetical protein
MNILILADTPKAKQTLLESYQASYPNANIIISTPHRLHELSPMHYTFAVFSKNIKPDVKHHLKKLMYEGVFDVGYIVVEDRS